MRVPSAARGRSRHRGRAFRALRVLALLSIVGAGNVVRAQARPAPQRYVLRQVRLGTAEDAPVRTLVLDGGRIAAVLAPGEPEPPAARAVEGEGLIALPAFVDAFTTTGVANPTPEAEQDVPVPIDSGPRIDMREANRKGIQPSFRAAQALELPADKAKAWREAGFGALSASPSGQILAGTSALVTTRDAAARDLVLLSDVWMHAAFRASGPGYPSTLMGYQAQLRQLMLDAQRHAELGRRYAEGRPGRRPPFDAELGATLPLLDGSVRVACQADRATDIERWMALSDEFGLRIAIVGGREAWRVRERLAERGIPVILTLDWGEEPEAPHAEGTEKPDEGAEDESAARGAAPEQEGAAEQRSWAYEEPLGVRAERRRLWEQDRDGALRLAEAGIELTFGSGAGSATELVEKVRTLVEQGLAEEVALGALTSRAAALLGAARQLGAIETGRDATLCLWTASPFEQGAKLAWVFVDGFPHELDLDADETDGAPPDDGVDATGTWALSFEGEGQTGTRRGSAVLTMAEDGAVSGTLTTEGMGGEEMRAEVEGRVSGARLTLKGVFSMEELQIAITVRAEIAGDELEGESVGKAQFGQFSSKVRGTREPQRSREVQR